MESALNPYSPGSGRRPTELAGRDKEIAEFDLLIAKTKRKRPDRGIILHGLRGVGKTVLLNEFRRQAERAEFMVIVLEGRADDNGPEAARTKLARALLQAGRKLNHRGAGAKLKRALGSIASFSTKIGVTGVEIGVEINSGRADSGSIEIDLEELIEDLCEALTEKNIGLIFFIDEMQDLDQNLITALLSVQHRASQNEWPFYIAGAGLPNLPSTLSQARSYAERLFTYREIGALEAQSAKDALIKPANDVGVRYTSEASALILDASDGYPYFIQEFGYAAWETATDKTISSQDASLAIEIGRSQLDQGFFPSRWKRASKAEKTYLQLMALDGDAGSLTSEIAERAGKKQNSMTMTRAGLIDKGIIFAPSLGKISFTVPGMAGYIRRTAN